MIALLLCLVEPVYGAAPPRRGLEFSSYAPDADSPPPPPDTCTTFECVQVNHLTAASLHLGKQKAPFEAPPNLGPHPVDMFILQRWTVFPTGFPQRRSVILASDKSAEALMHFEAENPGRLTTYREVIRKHMLATNGTAPDKYGVYGMDGLPTRDFYGQHAWPMYPKGTHTNGFPEARYHRCGAGAEASNPANLGSRPAEWAADGTALWVTLADPNDPKDLENEGDWLWDMETGRMVGLPMLLSYDVYVPSTRTESADETFPLWNPQSLDPTASPTDPTNSPFDFWGHYFVRGLGRFAEETQVKGSLIRNLMEDDLNGTDWLNGAVPQHVNVYDRGSDSFVMNRVNVGVTDRGDERTSSSTLKELQAAAVASYQKRMELLRVFKDLHVGLVGLGRRDDFERLLLKLSTHPSIKRAMSWRVHFKVHPPSFIMDPVTRVWGTSYDFNNVLRSASASPRAPFVVVEPGGRGNKNAASSKGKLPLVMGDSNLGANCPHFASHGMVCVSPAGHYNSQMFAGSKFPGTQPVDILAHVREGKPASTQLWDANDATTNIMDVAGGAGRAGPTWGVAYMDNYFGIPSTWACRRVKDNAGAFALGLSSTEYMQALYIEHQKTLRASPLVDVIDFRKVAVGGRSGNGMLVNAASDRQAGIGVFAGDLDMNFVAAIPVDPTIGRWYMSWAVDADYTELWSNGGAISHSPVDVAEMLEGRGGYEFPVLLHEPIADTFGLTHAQALPGTHPFTLSHSRIMQRIFRNMTVWARGNSFVAYWGTEHGYAQTLSSNYQDGGRQRRDAFGQDISAFTVMGTSKLGGPSGAFHMDELARSPTASDEFSYEAVYKRYTKWGGELLAGQLHFLRRWLLSEWQATNEAIAEALPGHVIRSPWSLPDAADVLTHAEIDQSVRLPLDITLGNDFKTDLVELTPAYTLQKHDLAAMGVLNLPYCVELKALHHDYLRQMLSFNLHHAVAATVEEAPVFTNPVMDRVDPAAFEPYTWNTSTQIFGNLQVEFGYFDICSSAEDCLERPPAHWRLSADTKAFRAGGLDEDGADMVPPVDGQVMYMQIHLPAHRAGTFSMVARMFAANADRVAVYPGITAAHLYAKLQCDANFATISELSFDYCGAMYVPAFLMTGVEQSRNTNETFRFASPHVDGSDLAHPVETILVTFEKPMNKRQGPEEEEASENNGPDSAWFSNLLFKHADYNETAPVPDLGGRPTIDISTPDAETLLSWKSGTSASLSAEQLDLLDEAQASLCFTIKSNIFAKGSLVIRQGTTPLPRDFSGAHPRML